MEIAAYEIVLGPCGHLDPAATARAEDVHRLILKQWPQVSKEPADLRPYEATLLSCQYALMYVSETGCFEIILGDKPGTVVSLRLAYCNPATADSAYLGFAGWLMDTFGLCARTSRDSGPPSLVRPCDEPVRRREDLHAVFSPGLEYNRRLWQLEMQTDEAACILPVEAVRRFVLPRLAVASSVPWLAAEPAEASKRRPPRDG